MEGAQAVAVLAAHYLSGPIGALIGRATQPGMLLIVGLALCFALALVAELIGLAGIVGAFAAGLLLDPYGRGVRTPAHEMTLSELMQPLSHVFVPLFFVLIGLQVHLPSLAGPRALVLGGALIVAGVAGKVATALVAGRASENRLAVGIGMVPRGEVGLVFAGIGTALTIAGEPLLDAGTFSAVVLMVLVTTLAAPVGLRWALGLRART